MYNLEKLNTKYIKKSYSIFKTLELINEDTFCINANTANLYLDGVKITTGFDINDLCDIITKDVSTKADHTLPMLQLVENELHVYSEFTGIDIDSPFIILDSKAFKRIKLLKKDEPFLEFYTVNNCVFINYGVLNKEHFSISGNGLLTP